MRRLRLTTAGESHGPGLTAILEGLPAGSYPFICTFHPNMQGTLVVQ